MTNKNAKVYYNSQTLQLLPFLLLNNCNPDKIMSRKKYFNVVLLLIIGTFIITAIIWLKQRFDELQMQQNAEMMIRTIDFIKNEAGFYPDNLIYLESDSGIGPFYEKLTDSTYRIIYTIGFDDYYEYRSINNSWQYFP